MRRVCARAIIEKEVFAVGEELSSALENAGTPAWKYLQSRAQMSGSSRRDLRAPLSKKSLLLLLHCRR